jgi:malto-oligosyltrehalose synthase/4-alpha-glucanotransferase
MNNPIATYRLQFHKDFKFEDLRNIIPYLHDLGVGTIYASPVFRSTEGSTHGYDGVDPNEIDPEIGTLEELKSTSSTLRGLGMGWLQDIVPNHMAFHSENPWLTDLLEKGKQSQYSSYFDVAWNSRLFQGKLMVPFLGTDLNEILEQEAIKVEYQGGRFVLKYEDATYPLSPESYLLVLDSDTCQGNQALQQIVSQIRQINEIEDSVVFSSRWDELLAQLGSLREGEVEGAMIGSCLEKVNADKASLKKVIDRQSYVLCNWQKTEFQINFRRFFTINGLICLNIQNPEVFARYHHLTKALVQEGVFQGLRIDHIDGLFDPADYMTKLRELAGDDTFVVIEKILERAEELPTDWPIQGTTGYEFLAWVNNLMTDATSEKSFSDFYRQLTGMDETLEEQLLAKKSSILYDHMGGELDNLLHLFIELDLVEKEMIESLGADTFKRVIGSFLIHCPVYRYYGNALPFSPGEAAALGQILNEIRERHPDLSEGVAEFEKVLLERTGYVDQEYNKRVLQFYQRCMQFTGPLMAKGGEDTLMYTNNRFVGHNDVGDSPHNFGLSVEDFHKKMKNRQENWPLGLNATSTHDTKRGEDVRARLNVLTELSTEFFEHVRRWVDLNAPVRELANIPDRNDEYLIYQTLLGAFPIEAKDEKNFGDRIEEYIQKALREAKVHSNWAEPNEEYENGAKRFARSLLDKESPFWRDFAPFHQDVAEFGIVNSLTQTLLKFTLPGTPDVYQGCELWDFSLVDPDNRRPVDFEKRTHLLAEFEKSEYRQDLLKQLWHDRRDAGIKLWLTRQLFHLRRQHERLFAEGSYIALKVQGALKEHVLAFARVHRQTALVVAVPLRTASLCREQQTDFFGIDWQDTKIALPPRLDTTWELVLNDTQQVYQDKIAVADLFKQFPAAILKGKKPENKRRAGILLHISSLSSSFGIGDLGPEAYRFADFLNRSKQRVWQLLPLNPTESGQGHSPYSALSSQAGNALLISPELLAEAGLLDGVDLADYKQPESKKVDFEKAEQIRNKLLEKAYHNFKSKKDESTARTFEKFCVENKQWLEDFSLYMVLRKQHNQRPWIEWEEQHKLRDPGALKAFSSDHADHIRFVKWVQFVFDTQWKALKNYCHNLDIKLLGDMPFYVSYNSSDVWSHRDLFMLDDEGGITGIAGVPPDAFSATGQLWGMPVFAWHKHKEQDYHWWIQRLRKNVELFDTIRLDHFRAFSDYWVVPGGAKVATNGKWEAGPDAGFFQVVKQSLGSLPFIAEDLGEISPEVYALRDQFGLPGMKVLQFSFDENMPQSDHIPHAYSPNFIAYTGTHDNNTMVGWYRKDTDEATRNRLQAYVGLPVSEQNVSQVAARMVYSSVASTAIIPVQDALGLDESAKMNSPGTGDDNWAWRLLPGQLDEATQTQLACWTVLYDRD